MERAARCTVPTMTFRGVGRTAGALTTALLVATTLTACTDEPDASDPDGAARLIAAGLSRLDLAAAPVAGTGVTTLLREAVSGLGAKPSTEVVSVSEGDLENRREVTLRTRWAFGSEHWTYRTSFELKNAGTGWQTAWSPALVHPDLEPGERLVSRDKQPQRADILARDGTPLVTSRGVFRIGIDRSMTGNDRSDALALARVVDIDPETYARKVEAYGAKAFVEAIMLRVEDVPAKMKAQLQSIEGASRLRDDVPLAPSATFAAPVLGKVGPATAEVVKRSEGQIASGQQVGLSGLQAEYEERLSGKPTVTILATRDQADGTSAEREIATIGGERGRPLRLTLDVDLQWTAESLLTRFPDQPSAIVAIQPSSGELLAVASGPGGQGLDTARTGRFAPGSTFKVVSSLALLRAGLDPGDTVSCPNEIRSNGRAFANFPDYPSTALGSVPYRTALANSCNTALISEGKRVTNADLASAGRALGLMHDSPSGYFGDVPEKDAGVEHDASMIGQGRILASPLAVATVAASVAAGERVTPRLVAGDAEKEPAKPDAALSGGEAESLRTLMRAVVTDGGAKGLVGLPGPPVLAKTGTAEYGTGDPPGVLSWMMAVQGDIAVAVLVKDGGYGGDTCLPLVKAMLQADR